MCKRDMRNFGAHICATPPCLEGPNCEKKTLECLNRAWQLQSRLKFSTLTFRIPTNERSWWAARLKFHSRLKIFKKKILAHIKIKSALPPPAQNPKYPPPPKTFLQNGRIFPGAHIGAAISGPRIADKNFTDTRIFLKFQSRRDLENYFQSLGPQGGKHPLLEISDCEGQPPTPTATCQTAKSTHHPHKSTINIASAKLGVVRILPILLRFRVGTIRTPPLRNYHLMRKVFCGDGAWFAVP